VGIKRLTGDEEAHDLAAALEDGVDAGVAEEALDRVGGLATGAQGVGGLVSRDHRGSAWCHRRCAMRSRCPRVWPSGFEADVGVLVGIDESGNVTHGGLERVGVGGHAGEFVGDGGVLADGVAPLLAVARPAGADVEAALGERPAQAAGRVMRPVLRVVKATFNPRPTPPRTFSTGTRTFVKRMTPL
jgi:hypothetical protein